MALDPAALLTIGGPTGIIGALIAVLIKSYFDARKDNREQQASDVTTDSGVLDNAKKVLELVRNETDRLEFKMLELTEENKKKEAHNKELEAHINRQDDTIARQGRQIEFLTSDLAQAMAQIEELRRGRASG